MADNSKQVLAMASVVVVVLLLVAGMFAISTSSNDKDKDSTITIINPGKTYYELTVNVGEGGYADPSGVTEYKKGTNVTITFIPMTNYEIENVIVDGDKKGAVKTVNVTMDKKHEVSVSFVFTGIPVTPGQPEVVPEEKVVTMTKGGATTTVDFSNVSVVSVGTKGTAGYKEYDINDLKIELNHDDITGGQFTINGLKIISLNLLDGTTKLNNPTFNGNVIVTVEFADAKGAGAADVYYNSEKLTGVTSEVIGGGLKVSFPTTHFSEYTITDGKIDLENKTITVKTSEDLAKIDNLNENDFREFTFSIINDIEMPETWKPLTLIFENNSSITINGNGNSIIGMNIIESLSKTNGRDLEGGAGLFGYIENVSLTIEDLIFENSTIKATGSHFGVVIGIGYGSASSSITLNDVDVIGGSVESLSENGIRIGGLIGALMENKNATISNSDISNMVIKGYHSIGGVIGLVNIGSNSTTITNSTINDTEVIYSDLRNPSAAGHISAAYHSAYASMTYTDSNLRSINSKVTANLENGGDLTAVLNSAKAGDELSLFDKEYKLPATITDGVIIKGVEGTKIVFKEFVREIQGVMNTNNSTFVGLTFDNTVILTGSATFDNCTFDGGIGYSVIKDDVTLRNCIVQKMTKYNLDNGEERDENVSMKLMDDNKALTDAILISVTNCKFYAGVNIGFENENNKDCSVEFNRCSFEGPVNWSKALIISYIPITLNNCTFDLTEGADREIRLAVGMALGDVTAYNKNSSFETIDVGGMIYNIAGFNKNNNPVPSYGEQTNNNSKIYKVEIYDGDGLKHFANQVNVVGRDYAGYTVTLMNDIDLDKKEVWTPIGDIKIISNTGILQDHIGFLGIFDGNNKTISNLTVNDLGGRTSTAGFFGVLAGTVKNLTISGATINSNHYAGGIAAYSHVNTVSIIDCIVTGSTITTIPHNNDDGDKAGGIIGHMGSGGTVSGCTVSDTTINGYRNLGGIVGASLTSPTECTVENITILHDRSIIGNEPGNGNQSGAIMGTRIFNGTIDTSNVVKGTVTLDDVDVLESAIEYSEGIIEIILMNGEYIPNTEYITTDDDGNPSTTVKGNVIDISSEKIVVMYAAEDQEDVQFKGQFKVTGKLTVSGIKMYTTTATTDISQFSKSGVALMNDAEFVATDVNFIIDLSEGTAITAWWSTGDGANISVESCIFDCNGQRPIRSDASVTVKNCVFKDPYRYAVQLTSKNSTISAAGNATVNFEGNTIIAGNTVSGNPVYGVQLEGEEYGCSNLTINGSGNTIDDGDTGKTCAMYYCECDKVKCGHDGSTPTVTWNVSDGEVVHKTTQQQAA